MGFVKPKGGPGGGGFFEPFPESVYCVSPSRDIKPRKGDKAAPFRFLVSTVFHAEWAYRSRRCMGCDFDFGTAIINQENDDSICPTCGLERLTGDGAHPCLPQWVGTMNKVVRPKNKQEICIPFQYVCPEDADVIWGMLRRDGRDDLGVLLQPPTRDPLLILQEFLRAELSRQRIHQDMPVFQWEFGSEVRVWTALNLSGIIPKKDKPTKEDKFQTLMPEQRTLMVVMPYRANMSSAEMQMKLASFKRSVYEELFSMIKMRMQTLGDTPGARVNPQETPYVLVALYNTEAKFGESKFYLAMADDRAEVTQQMLDVVGSERFPDPYRYNFPLPGTKEELRGLMEEAARTAGSHDIIPWAELFDNSDWVERPVDDTPPRQPPTSRPASITTRPAPTPPTSPPPAPAAPSGRKPTGRQPRAQAAPAAPPPGTLPTFSGEAPVTLETAQENKCGVSACGMPMHPGWNRCPGCDSEYDPVDGYDPVSPPTVAQLRAAHWPVPGPGGPVDQTPTSPAPAPPKPPNHVPPPKAPAPAEKAKRGRRDVVQCWSCAGDVPAKIGAGGKLEAAVDQCPRCHAEQQSEEQLEAMIRG